jgi:hypothetical protein
VYLCFVLLVDLLICRLEQHSFLYSFVRSSALPSIRSSVRPAVLFRFDSFLVAVVPSESNKQKKPIMAKPRFEEKMDDALGSKAYV